MVSHEGLFHETSAVLYRLSLKRGFGGCEHRFSRCDGLDGLRGFDGLGGFSGFNGFGGFSGFSGFDGYPMLS